MKKYLFLILIAFLIPSVTLAAVTRVQGAKKYPSGASFGLAFTSNNTAGNLIVVEVGDIISSSGTATTSPPTVTDSQGNNYIFAVGFKSSSVSTNFNTFIAKVGRLFKVNLGRSLIIK